VALRRGGARAPSGLRPARSRGHLAMNGFEIRDGRRSAERRTCCCERRDGERDAPAYDPRGRDDAQPRRVACRAHGCTRGARHEAFSGSGSGRSRSAMCTKSIPPRSRCHRKRSLRSRSKNEISSSSLAPCGCFPSLAREATLTDTSPTPRAPYSRVAPLWTLGKPAAGFRQPPQRNTSGRLRARETRRPSRWWRYADSLKKSQIHGTNGV